jgi:type VI secretion system secreted protein Hcp
MSSNMYIKFKNPEIEGEASDSEHEKEIEVLAWSHSFHQPTSSTRVSAGGGTVERANHSDFSFTKLMDTATDDLLKHCWSGKHIDKAVFSCYRANGDNKPVKYLEVEMEHVIISSVSFGGGPGDVPSENVSLNYGKVTYNYIPQDEKEGTAGAVQPVSHDLMQNTVS